MSPQVYIRDVIAISALVIPLLLGLGLIVAGLISLRRATTAMSRALAGGVVLVGAVAVLTLVGAAFGTVGIGLAFFPVMVALGVFAAIFWIVMLADCAMNEPDQGNNKIIWVVIIVFTGVIGAALYYCLRRPQRLAQASS